MKLSCARRLSVARRPLVLSTLFAASVLTGCAASGAVSTTLALQTHWVATWTASPQPIWGSDFSFPTNIPDRLHNQTIRQVARVSLGGHRVRLVLSNAYGNTPLYVGTVSVAISAEGAELKASTLRAVTFSGQSSATIPPGAPLLSDPIDLEVSSLSRLTISIYLPQDTPTATFHWDGRQTAWITPGDQTTAATIDPHARSTEIITTRTVLTGIDVLSRNGGRHAVAVIGDSTTDGNGVAINSDARWPDFLAARLAPYGVAVINAGISGARLLSDKMGVNALARFQRDVLDQPGVSTAVVLVGINDISWPGTAFDPKGHRPTLEMLEAGYQQLVAQAHRRRVRVIGVTIMPFKGALEGTPLNNYFEPDKDAMRQELNTWIRNSGVFDGVLDFDLWARDPADPARLNHTIDSGDHLHPGNRGNKLLADAIPLHVLVPELAKTTNDR